MRVFILICLFLVSLDHGLANEPKVLKETPYDYEKDENGKLIVKKRRYTAYRPLWGKRFTVISAEHTPTPELLDQDRLPIQIEVSLLRNLSFLSFGAEAGFMSVEWENPEGSKIGMSNFYFGLIAHLDGLFSTPYVVPFASVGGISFDADVAGASIPTDSDVTLYYRAGLLFSLNWIDKLMAIRAYDDFGLLNSYIYVGVRKWMETNSNPSLNIEIDPSLEFGLQLEF